MIKTEDKTIDSKKITVTSFPGRKSLNLKNRIIVLLGESFAQLIGQVKSIKTTKLKDMDVSILVPVIERFTQKLDPDTFTDFTLELLSMSRVDGKEITIEFFDNEFSGNLLFMYKILAFVLEVNYGDFFGKNGIGKIIIPAVKK